MATKTFKIGLSNAEKQAMAQAIYERVLDLTFPEYDTTTSYEVGDFVVYNDQLYKCIGATSGAWDSTKWQLATLNDLLTDIENAVAFVNDKANVDGNYPTMTVGVADQLSPYDDESGDDQSEPFSFQATGTGNGSQPDFSTGAIALMKEKQGNTVVVNQLAQDVTDTITISGITFTKVDSSKLTISGTATERVSYGICSSISVLYDHYYLIFGMESNTQNVGLIFNGYNGNSYVTTYSGKDTGNGLIIKNTNVNVNKLVIECVIENGTALSKTYTIVPKIIDLTQWFNGDIPQDLLDHPENFFRYYQGSLAYNTGELVNANGRYIKCIGRQQWDEEWELGNIDATNGENVENTVKIRSKNYIKVIPNTVYYFKSPVGLNLYFYDADGNYIGFDTTTMLGNQTYLIPQNCYKLRFSTFGGSTTTYNHDITISLYYEGESGYDQYYPYEVITNNDTGTETLRSAGSVHDIKLPSGEIKRNIGYVDLGSLTWTNFTSIRWKATLPAAIKVTDSNYQPKCICSTFTVLSANKATGKDGEMWFNASDNTEIYCASQSSPTGKLNYELAEPTTEQGTPYSENLVIDDFGSMDFSGTNGVPQGNLIFYPVDYKAFIDTLYNYADGTPSNIALKSDLASDKTELQGVDTQLLNAIGGTLRQLLAVSKSIDFLNTDFVDLGSLTWNITSGDGATSSTTLTSLIKKPADNTTLANILCSQYKNVVRNSVFENVNNICCNSSGTIIIYNPIFDGKTSAEIQALFKGVLLAYEKAEE